jgi:two-component system, NtrC family, nitrogen regulation response regulator GlnG
MQVWPLPRRTTKVDQTSRLSDSVKSNGDERRSAGGGLFHDIVPTARIEGPPRKVISALLAITVTSGPDRGRQLPLRPGVLQVGKSLDCDLVLTDPAVSKNHLQISMEGQSIEVRDSGSKNGCFYRGARFTSLQVRPGAVIRIGHTEILLTEISKSDSSDLERLGRLHGRSRAMRQLYLRLQRFGAADIPLLITGETGTGKELAAEAVHLVSPRREGPLIVCDLAAISPSLIESELFGHARGSFTGADRDRPGAFELANGGTIFLDEIGELDAALQPRLLRVLDTGQVKRVGESRYRNVDVRIVAATHRDLTAAVAAGTFREDLYYRLAAAAVTVPPLRARLDDLPLLVDLILAELSIRYQRQLELDPQALGQLSAYDWPGNVRQLRNALERAAVTSDGNRVMSIALPAPAAAPQPPSEAPKTVDLEISFKDAKQRLIGDWEHDYLVALLNLCGGNVSLAARKVQLDRVHFHRLLRKHELSSKGQ